MNFASNVFNSQDIFAKNTWREIVVTYGNIRGTRTDSAEKQDRIDHNMTLWRVAKLAIRKD